jgi:hypothetical protein
MTRPAIPAAAARNALYRTTGGKYAPVPSRRSRAQGTGRKAFALVPPDFATQCHDADHGISHTAGRRHSAAGTAASVPSELPKVPRKIHSNAHNGRS